jgi:hypothetical protein
LSYPSSWIDAEHVKVNAFLAIELLRLSPLSGSEAKRRGGEVIEKEADKWG